MTSQHIPIAQIDLAEAELRVTEIIKAAYKDRTIHGFMSSNLCAYAKQLNSHAQIQIFLQAINNTYPTVHKAFKSDFSIQFTQICVTCQNPCTRPVCKLDTLNKEN